jgi:hypothetical protein
MAKIISVPFTSSGVAVTGLHPTINIYQLGAGPSNTEIVTNGGVSEIGGGWYRYDFLTYDPTTSYVFTIDGGPTLADFDRYKHGGNESYEEDISTSVWNEPIGNHTASGSTGETLIMVKADTTSILISDITLTTLLNLILKYERNRTVIDTINSQLIIYDNDNTTIIQAFDLKDINGLPSVADVLERVPTM